jgi:hypothetical protein
LLSDGHGSGFLCIVLALQRLGDELRGDTLRFEIGGNPRSPVSRAAVPRCDGHGHRRVIDVSGVRAPANRVGGRLGGVPAPFELALEACR